MVKKVNRAQAAPAAPVRAPRKSSALTRKRGRSAPQTAVQPQPQYVVAAPGATVLNTPTTYKVSRWGKKNAVQAGPPALPQLGTAATAVPGLVPAPGTVPELVAAKRPGDDLAAAFGAAQRWAWRYRWQLVPLVASTTTIAGAATLPVLTVLGLGAVAGAGYATAAKGPEELAGRKWLSRPERRLVGRWAAGAAVWSAGIGLTNVAGLHWSPATVAIAGAALGVFTGEQLVGWLKSRQIRRDGSTSSRKLSDSALQLRAAWPHAVATGPDCLAGSRIVDMTEPSPGTIVAVVQLRPDVHAAAVTNDVVRHWLERALHMGVGTAQVESVRDDAGQVRLILTPSRQLEKVEKIWPGPVLHPDGRIPVAVTNDARDVCLRAFNKTGVYHFLLIGSSGSGKSNTMNVMLLPTVINGFSVMVYLDGKKGTSSPRLARAMDTAVRDPEQFGPAIEMVYKIMVARQKRYGDLGLDDFAASATGDPIIDLVIDECNALKRHLKDRHEDMLAEMALTGRALGISLKYAGQRAKADDLPGGMDVRDQMMGTVGNVVALRPGGTHTQTATLQTTSEEIDLMSLPGGENAGGWCAILLAGQVAGFPARMMFDPKEGSRVEQVLDGFVPRTLEGEDLKAAGEFYTNRPTGAAWYAKQLAARKAQAEGKAGHREPTTVAAPPAAPQAPVDEPEESDLIGDLDAITGRLSEALDQVDGGRVVEIGQRQAAKGGRNQQLVLAELHAAGPEGTTAAALAGAVGLGLSTVNAHISRLVVDGKASREGTLIRARLDAGDNE